MGAPNKSSKLAGPEEAGWGAGDGGVVIGDVTEAGGTTGAGWGSGAAAALAGIGAIGEGLGAVTGEGGMAGDGGIMAGTAGDGGTIGPAEGTTGADLAAGAGLGSKAFGEPDAEIKSSRIEEAGIEADGFNGGFWGSSTSSKDNSEEPRTAGLGEGADGDGAAAGAPKSPKGSSSTTLCFKTSNPPAVGADLGKGAGAVGGAGFTDAGAAEGAPGKSTSLPASMRESEEAGSGVEGAGGLEIFKAAFEAGPAANIGCAKSGLSSDTTSKTAGSGVKAPETGPGISPASSLFSQGPQMGFI
jgi:hypothetical protein